MSIPADQSSVLSTNDMSVLAGLGAVAQLRNVLLQREACAEPDFRALKERMAELDQLEVAVEDDLRSGNLSQNSKSKPLILRIIAGIESYSVTARTALKHQFNENAENQAAMLYSFLDGVAAFSE